MNSDKQIYIAEVQIYGGQKLILKYGAVLRFSLDTKTNTYIQLDASVEKDNQKTLSSTKTSIVTIRCDLPIYDTGTVKVNDHFILSDGFDKIGKGKIIEILKQE